MKSRNVMVLTAVAVVLVVGLFVVISGNATASVSSGQQGISACSLGQPDIQLTGEGCNKSKSDPNEGKKKCDPNEGKKIAPSCHK